MTKTIATLVFISAIIILSSACKKSDAGGTTTPPPPPTPGTTATILKDASGIPVAVGISYSLMNL